MSNTDQEIDTQRVLSDIRELKEDVAQNMRTLVGIVDIGDMLKHLRETLWPTIESLIDRISDLADIVDVNEDAMLELANEQGDQLTPETAKEVLTIFVLASAITEALKQRLTPADPPELAEKIATFEKELARVTELVEDSVLDSDDDDEDDNE